MEYKRTFSYPEPYKTFWMLNSILIVILFGYVFISETQTLSQSIIENGVSNPDVFGYVVLMLIFASVATTIMNYHQEFTVSGDGIEFQSFYFWRIFVPWTEIVGKKHSWHGTILTL